MFKDADADSSGKTRVLCASREQLLGDSTPQSKYKDPLYRLGRDSERRGRAKLACVEMDVNLKVKDPGLLPPRGHRA